MLRKKYQEQPEELHVQKKRYGKVEVDELWSFVMKKQNKQWVWLALDRRTREIIAYHVGRRSKEDARKFWQSYPPVYRQCATIYSNQWEAYQGILPINKHRIIEKKKRETNHIERFNNTLRQRIYRLGRKTLFLTPKKLSHHIASLIHFIQHYHSSLTLSSS